MIGTSISGLGVCQALCMKPDRLLSLCCHSFWFWWHLQVLGMTGETFPGLRMLHSLPKWIIRQSMQHLSPQDQIFFQSLHICEPPYPQSGSGYYDLAFRVPKLRSPSRVQTNGTAPRAFIQRPPVSAHTNNPINKTIGTAAALQEASRLLITACLIEWSPFLNCEGLQTPSST